jgi:hypothetical protein
LSYDLQSMGNASIYCAHMYCVHNEGGAGL